MLPEIARTEIGHARQRLDTDAQLFLWGLAFVVWTVLAWWALPVGLLVAAGAHRSLLSDARLYASLMTSAYDLYRFGLYAALHWPQPNKTAEEQVVGARLTRYLDRGAADGVPNFTHSQDRRRGGPPPCWFGVARPVDVKLASSRRWSGLPSATAPDRPAAQPQAAEEMQTKKYDQGQPPAVSGPA